MTMTINELLPELHNLSRTDKYSVMQFLIADLAREELDEVPEEIDLFPNEEPCPIWTSQTSEETEWFPTEESNSIWTSQESFESARSLLRALREKAIQEE